MYTDMLAVPWQRFSSVFVLFGLALLLSGRQSAQQNSGKKTVLPVPKSLSGYLHLTDQQSISLADALANYNEAVESRRADQRSAQMRAAADPSVNANRLIEQDELGIKKARAEARACIAEILSADQLSQLRELAAEQPQSEEQARLAEDAAGIGLVQPRTRKGKQPFGGTVPIFASDTASQPDIDEPAATKKPLAKRPPPSSPPQ